jgi:hypothetical protein
MVFFFVSKIIFFATMRLRLGVGAVGLVLFKNVKPSAQVRELRPNLEHGAWIENCVVLQKEIKRISRREQDAVIFRCEELFGDLELYTMIHWFVVTQEGPIEDLFDQATIPSPQGVSEEAEIPTSEVADAIARRLTGALDDVDEAAICRTVETDDDNLPVPENVPTGNTRTIATGDQWEHDGICPRRASSATNNRPSLRGISETPSLVRLFEALLPVEYIKLVMLPKMNQRIQPPVLYGEFLRWLGLWFILVSLSSLTVAFVFSPVCLGCVLGSYQ